MTDQKAKAEAEKIIQEYEKIYLEPDFEGTMYITVSDDQIKYCAIIKVEGIIESNPSSPIPDGYYELLQDRIDYATDYWNSILTELNNM